MQKAKEEETKIKNVISLLKSQKIDDNLVKGAEVRLDSLTKPKGSLGKLENIAKKLATIKNSLNINIDKKLIIVVAGDHGVAEEGVSLFPQVVTTQMLKNFIDGNAAINVVARQIKAEIVVVDVGCAGDLKSTKLITKKIGFGTKNITKTQAMSKEEAIKSLCIGIELTEILIKKYEPHILIIGDMGIANTTPSACIISLITKKPPELTVGKGTGLDDKRLEHKINVVKKAILVNKPNNHPLDILSKVGGYEIGAACGIILRSASLRIPIVLDGYIITSAALLAYEFCDKVTDFCFAGHLSKELGHKLALDYLNLEPILDLDMRLGEGTGAAVATSVIEASAKLFTQMKTFEEAGVATAEQKITNNKEIK